MRVKTKRKARSLLVILAGPCETPRNRFLQNLVMVSFFHLALGIAWVFRLARVLARNCRATTAPRVLEIGSLVAMRFLPFLLMIVKCLARACLATRHVVAS